MEWVNRILSMMNAARGVASLRSLELADLWAFSMPVSVSVSQLLLSEKAETFLRAYDSMPRMKTCI